MIDPNRIVRGSVNEIAPGVYYVPALMANVYFVGDRSDWVMVDAGTPGTAARIRMTAQYIFGDRRPSAIVLTHGHFDHVGALRELAEEWDTPVFAHPLELPYLDGRDNYPPPDPTVGGFMAQLSRMFPRKGINVGQRLHAIMLDNTIPHMPGWRAVHTPGHAPGHISLFRDSDRTLIAGDAVITLNQENAVRVLTQVREIHPPPLYLTIDWDRAVKSAQKLADLRPRTLATGHGLPMSGEDVADKLSRFAERFHRPARGRYVASPALTDEQGVYYIPPAPRDPLPMYAAGIAMAAAGLMLLGAGRKQVHSGRSALVTRDSEFAEENGALPRESLEYDIFGRKPE